MQESEPSERDKCTTFWLGLGDWLLDILLDQHYQKRAVINLMVLTELKRAKKKT